MTRSAAYFNKFDSFNGFDPCNEVELSDPLYLSDRFEKISPFESIVYLVYSAYLNQFVLLTDSIRNEFDVNGFVVFIQKAV